MNIFIVSFFVFMKLIKADMAPGPNIALNKKTSASSTNTNRYPSLAVDGNYEVSTIADCFSSTLEVHPWISIDLGREAMLMGVKLSNVIKDPSELGNFEVLVSNKGPPLPGAPEDGYKLCHHHTGTVESGQFVLTPCSPGSVGRYVYVRNKSTESTRLPICEMDVYGVLKAFDTDYFTCEDGKMATNGTSLDIAKCNQLECAFRCSLLKGCVGFNFNLDNCACETVSIKPEELTPTDDASAVYCDAMPRQFDFADFGVNPNEPSG